MWLRDYLPSDIPNHRLIVYGYNTKLQGNESKQSIEHLGTTFMESLNVGYPHLDHPHIWDTITPTLPPSFLTTFTPNSHLQQYSFRLHQGSPYIHCKYTWSIHCGSRDKYIH
ncbi:hypothetical protein F5B17DRAFT_282903 [Nemania serpens]|nr:hypothetical protein F5B17DRAFT_282903 [Nemania serpens]